MLFAVNSAEIRVTVKTLWHSSPHNWLSRDELLEGLARLENVNMPCLLVSNRPMSQAAQNTYNERLRVFIHCTLFPGAGRKTTTSSARGSC
jgi:hypothetical protein